MWCTAERRVVRHVCQRTLFPPFLLRFASIHSPPAAGSWDGQYASPVLHFAYIMPIASLQLEKKAPVSCREAKRLGTQLWSPRLVTILWLCSQLCYETAANQWTIVEVEFLATVGWKCGCQPFSYQCSQNVTQCRKKIWSTCLFKTSIRAGISKHPLPTRSRFLRATVRSTSSALCLNHADRFVAAAGNNLSDAEKQSVWSRSCGFQDLLQCSDCALSRAIWLLQTNEQLSRLIF